MHQGPRRGDSEMNKGLQEVMEELKNEDHVEMYRDSEEITRLEMDG